MYMYIIMYIIHLLHYVYTYMYTYKKKKREHLSALKKKKQELHTYRSLASSS